MPKSYIAGPRQVSEATLMLSQSNYREKSRRKAENKKKSVFIVSFVCKTELNLMQILLRILIKVQCGELLRH